MELKLLVACHLSWQYRAHKRMLMLLREGRKGRQAIDVENGGEVDFREVWRMSLDGFEEVVQEWVEYRDDPEDDFEVDMDGYRVVYPPSPETFAPAGASWSN